MSTKPELLKDTLTRMKAVMVEENANTLPDIHASCRRQRDFLQGQIDSLREQLKEAELRYERLRKMTKNDHKKGCLCWECEP